MTGITAFSLGGTVEKQEIKHDDRNDHDPPGIGAVGGI
jgi:hypothetical protein